MICKGVSEYCVLFLVVCWWYAKRKWYGLNNPLFWIICPSFYFTEISGLNLKFLVICTNRIYLVYMNNYPVAGLRKNVRCDAQLSSVFSLICWKMAQQHRDRGRATAYVIGSALCVLSPHSPTSTSTIFTFISKYWNDTERSGRGGGEGSSKTRSSKKLASRDRAYGVFKVI